MKGEKKTLRQINVNVANFQSLVVLNKTWQHNIKINQAIRVL